MIPLVGESVAARTKGAPANSSLVHFIHDGCGLRFSFRRQDPINSPTDPETRQLRKSPAAFGTHAEARCDLLERNIAFGESVFFVSPCHTIRCKLTVCLTVKIRPFSLRFVRGANPPIDRSHGSRCRPPKLKPGRQAGRDPAMRRLRFQVLQRSEHLYARSV